LVGYKVDNNTLEGVRKVTNLGKNTNNAPKFKVEVSDAKLKLSTGEVSTWQSVRTRTMTSGFDTPIDATDDIYEIYGQTSGVSTKGVAYTSETKSDEPIVIDWECFKWTHLPVYGKTTFTPDGESSRVIDYGIGECDYSLTVSYKGFSFPVTIAQ